MISNVYFWVVISYHQVTSFGRHWGEITYNIGPFPSHASSLSIDNNRVLIFLLATGKPLAHPYIVSEHSAVKGHVISTSVKRSHKEVL